MTSPFDMTQPSLELRALNVRYGNKPVLATCTLCVPPTGVHVIMGPGGTGKTTLLRAVCQPGAMARAAHIEGILHYWNRPLSDSHHPHLVDVHTATPSQSIFEVLAEGWTPHTIPPVHAQRGWMMDLCNRFDATRLIHAFDVPWSALPPAEQRRACLLRHMVHVAADPDPALLCLDEPMRGLDDATVVCDTLAAIARHHPILLVTHHRARARRLAATAVLLAGGRFYGHDDATVFFGDTAHPHAAHFVRTGGSPLPSPSATSETIDPAFADYLEPVSWASDGAEDAVPHATMPVVHAA